MADIEDPPPAAAWPEEGFAPEFLPALPAMPHRYPDGWMRPLELRILYALASRTAGPVLEIGSWIGRSSSAIAAGLRDGGRMPAPVYDIVDFGPCSAAEWERRFGQKLSLEMGGGHVAAAVLHPGGPIALLIDNLRRNNLLDRVTSIVRGDALELPLARRYGMIFCDAVHGEAEAARTMPTVAALAAEHAILVFGDVTTEAFADVICAYLNPVRRYLLAADDRHGKLLVVEHRAPAPAEAPVAATPRLAALALPRPAPEPAAAEAQRGAAGALWRQAFAARGIERTVLLASTFRSGSTYVAGLLDANGLPGLGRERFAEAWRHVAPPPGPDFAAFAEGILAEARGGLFGAKLMWPHLARFAEATGHGREDAAALAALLGPARWVHVRRADKFAQAISFWRAKRSGRWHVYAAGAEPALDYDFAGIRDALHEIEQHDRLWEDFFARAGIDPVRVTYEEIEADPAGGTAAILTALGLSPAAPPATGVALRRQRDTLSGTLRERFLDDLYRL